MKLDYKDVGKIGITCSTFDLLHAGHVVMLEEAKRHCDYLIAALQVDPTQDRKEKNKPIQSVVERQIQLAAVRFVDEIVVYNTEKELDDIFLTLPINVRIIGEEYDIYTRIHGSRNDRDITRSTSNKSIISRSKPNN